MWLIDRLNRIAASEADIQAYATRHETFQICVYKPNPDVHKAYSSLNSSAVTLYVDCDCLPTVYTLAFAL